MIFDAMFLEISHINLFFEYKEILTIFATGKLMRILNSDFLYPILYHRWLYTSILVQMLTKCHVAAKL